jgi:hypothetical protein
MQNSANGESRSLHWVVSAGKEPSLIVKEPPLIVERLLFIPEGAGPCLVGWGC